MTAPSSPYSGRKGAPGALTSRIALAATRPLPRYVRARYRQEFLAEMYGMTRRARTRHSLDLLFRSVALRFAVRSSTGIAVPTTATPRSAIPARCRVGNHRWVMRCTTDGARFRQCARCGKDKYDGSAGPMDSFMAANPFGAGY